LRISLFLCRRSAKCNCLKFCPQKCARLKRVKTLTCFPKKTDLRKVGDNEAAFAVSALNPMSRQYLNLKNTKRLFKIPTTSAAASIRV